MIQILKFAKAYPTAKLAVSSQFFDNVDEAKIFAKLQFFYKWQIFLQPIIGNIYLAELGMEQCEYCGLSF